MGRPKKNTNKYYTEAILLDPKTYQWVYQHRKFHEPLGSVIESLVQEKELLLTQAQAQAQIQTQTQIQKQPTSRRNHLQGPVTKPHVFERNKLEEFRQWCQDHDISESEGLRQLIEEKLESRELNPLKIQYE